MSMPSCMRPQRQPNGLLIGPLTGQTKPDDDGAEDGAEDGAAVDPPDEAGRAAAAAAAACAARIWAPRSALTARSESISSASARSLAVRLERATSLSWRDAASESRAPTSADRVSATCAARAEMI